MSRETEFEDFFKSNYSRFYYFALQRVDDKEVCRDIVGDAFERVWMSFQEGYFYFDDQPLVDVMQELGRWYISVMFEREELMQLQVRYFCVRGETLERAIALLNHMKKIHATLIDNAVYIR